MKKKIMAAVLCTSMLFPTVCVNAETSESDIKSAIEKAIEDTIAQNGECFSYFKKVYKSKEQEEINEMMDDFIFKPSFEPSFIR